MIKMQLKYTLRTYLQSLNTNPPNCPKQEINVDRGRNFPQQIKRLSIGNVESFQL